jgi:hypothetical protein
MSGYGADVRGKRARRASVSGHLPFFLYPVLAPCVWQGAPPPHSHSLRARQGVFLTYNFMESLSFFYYKKTPIQFSDLPPDKPENAKKFSRLAAQLPQAACTRPIRHKNRNFDRKSRFWIKLAIFRQLCMHHVSRARDYRDSAGEVILKITNILVIFAAYFFEPSNPSWFFSFVK